MIHLSNDSLDHTTRIKFKNGNFINCDIV